MEQKRLQYHYTLWLVIIFAVIASGSQLNDSLKSNKPLPQQIQLRSFVEKSQVPLNRPVILHIELSWRGELSRYQIEPVSQPILTNLLLDGSGSENRLEPLEDGGFMAVKAITYRFRPLEMGMAYIDGIMIKYREGSTDLSESLSSQRIMIEIIDPIPEQGDNKVKSFLYIILLIIFFIIIFYFVMTFFRKRREAKKSPIPILSPAEIYLNRLVKEVDPRGTNLDEMIMKLSRIFREYLDQEFDLHAMELSTKEIVERFNDLELEDSERGDLQKVLEKLDVVKFTGKDVNPDDFTDIYGTIEKFLLKRKQIFEFIKDAEKEAK